MSAVPTSPGERPLWLTMAGATVAVPLGWCAWMAGVLLAGPGLAEQVGPAGGVIVVLAAGWLLARHAAAPLDWLRHYHLDDDEVTAIGPGRVVRRLPWARVERLVQERAALRLEGDGMRFGLPLARVLRSGAWGMVLMRVVPALAEHMWTRLEEGEEVRLAGAVEPRAGALAWWAWLPALAACAPGGGSLATGLLLAAGERLVALVRAHAASVSLHHTGVALRAGLRRLFVTWSHADVMRAPRGLLVGAADGEPGLVAARLPNFWAAAPVIETKAQLGPTWDATVHFRVRVAEGRLAVVGEIEPTA
jgi:hypothetical protein